MRSIIFALGVVLAHAGVIVAQPPSFGGDVRPFLAKYCLECHNARAQKGGLNLETYKGILEGSDKGLVLVAGKPDESPLVLSVEGKSKPVMPPKTAKTHPRPEETLLLRTWVRDGAKESGGIVKNIIPNIKPRKPTEAPITSVAYADSVIALGKYKLLQLIDLQNGNIADFPQTGNVTALAFSARANMLAAGIGHAGASAGLLLRRMGDSSQETRTLADFHEDAILDVAFSPDGKYLASASYDTRIKLLALQGVFDQPLPARLLKEHSDAVYAVAFSPDSKRLASCSADRAIKVWDVETAKLLYTLGDATDWLYTLAWSPDGKRLAAGGADKSIRTYEVRDDGAKIVQSVFAHEGPVQKIVYSEDGQTLYSLGQDQVVKSWDARRMVERKIYKKLPDAGLCLAVRQGQIAVGRYDGTLQSIDGQTGATLRETGSTNMRADLVPGDSPGHGAVVPLPLVIEGKLGKAGAVDFYRFEVKKGQQLGVKVEATDKQAKFDPFLELTGTGDRVLAATNMGFLGFTFTDAGVVAVGVRDRDFRGGSNMTYRLILGEVPVVTSCFPLGVERGSETMIDVKGVFLDRNQVLVKAPADAVPGSKIMAPITSSRGKPMGKLDLVVGEFPEVVMKAGYENVKTTNAGMVSVPGTANGRILQAGQRDVWKFTAKKGQQLVLETNARRLGSELDTVLDVLDIQGKPVPRALLRCQAKTYVTFRDHDSATAGIRIEAWNELATDDLIYAGGELMKIAALPTHPDADCFFFSANGQRSGFLDTTPMHHSQNEPMYKVSLHPPATPLSPNGYPLFTLYYSNDDGGPGYGRDSRILFDPPADADYLVRVGDARSQGGDNYAYRLTVRPPRPSFNIRFSPAKPSVWRGGAVPIRVSADRLDGYDGPIDIRFEGLPPGFSAPPTVIESGQSGTDIALYADNDAQSPASPSPFRVSGMARIGTETIRKEALGQGPQAVDAGDIVAFTEETAITVRPGEQVKLTVHIERRQGYLGRVPLEVRGLPHGVRVQDLGLNGILVNENEVRRTIVIQAESWVAPCSRPFVILAKREGKNTEHGARAVMLHVGAR